MDDLRPQSMGGNGNKWLQIGGNKLNTNWGCGGFKLNTTQGSGGIESIFDPVEYGDAIIPSPGDANSPSKPSVNAPEKKLTLFALQLALFEKMATGFGALGFIWATVVLLGGYAIVQSTTEFWFITVILTIEVARIFSRSQELEWKHQSTWTIAAASMHSFKALRTGSHWIVRILRRETQERTNEARPSYQLPRAYGRELKKKILEGKTSNQSRRTWTSSEVPLLPYACWIFQSKNISKLLSWLQLLSAITCITLSLMRLVQLTHGDAITPSRVCTETTNLRSALNIFYGLAMTEAFLSLLGKLYREWKITVCKLLAEVDKECEIGMISIKRFFYDAYSECVNGNIFDGLKLDLVSFATELLASHSSDKQIIGAGILQKFSTETRFSDDTLQKIGTCTSVIERLEEMLNWKNQPEAEISSDGVLDEPCEKQTVCDKENYEFSAYSQLGLTSLKKLARDHDNCEKIGNTKGLLLKIIDFTHTGEELLRNSQERDNRILAVKQSLQVLKLLARTSGSVGKHLRQEIVEIVFTVSNIREFLKYEPNSKAQNHVRFAAGEAIAMLALESERNCSRILNLKVLTELLRALKDQSLRINSARILRHLCKFAAMIALNN
ncbi:uncharacterized protein LOC122094816 [Macadamia integrifolia]|uniref:uncharacterized protein LOC122094816 n=1 Tax=Macadamia integrifolia TaxID=60698 RepID=UPI001C530659|nr:uncharacterized protein LOC122094816 [Macadamia integrifolia]